MEWRRFWVTWTAAGSPYVVTGDIYVNDGSSFTIESGVDVRFYGDFFLYVYGSLLHKVQRMIVFILGTIQMMLVSWYGINAYQYWNDGGSDRLCRM